MTSEQIKQKLESAVREDLKTLEQYALDAYVTSIIGMFLRNAASCSSTDVVISPASIAQEVSKKTLSLNKKDADTRMIAEVVTLYTVLHLVPKGYNITETKEGFLIQMYKDPDTIYLSTSDIKARINRMRVEYVQ